MSILSVDSISVEYQTLSDAVRAVQGVSLNLKEAQILGLAGESGCGKSTLAKAILRLLPETGIVVSGKINFKGKDLLRLSTSEFRELRWQILAYIPQNALNSLDPVYRVGDQVVEAILAHERVSRNAALDRARQLFSNVHLDERSLRAYPHQLSGGMRQRVLIAMAMALDPPIVIIDEPTTALDVVTQAQVLSELISMRNRTSSGMLYISHDLGAIRQLCNDVAVMYAGLIIETGNVGDIYGEPLHPYTMGLLNSVPKSRGAKRLVSIPGAPPNLRSEIQGCAFHPRCPFRDTRCVKETPKLYEISQTRSVACHYHHKAKNFRILAEDPNIWQMPEPREAVMSDFKEDIVP